MTDPPDTAAIRDRYFGDEDRRYFTGPVPRRDIQALLDEVERLRAWGNDDPMRLAVAKDQLSDAAFEIQQLLARLAELEAQLAEARAAAPHGGEWEPATLYGFVDPNTGEFIHHGDEGQARVLAAVVKKPVMQRQALYGPVTAADDTEADRG